MLITTGETSYLNEIVGVFPDVSEILIPTKLETTLRRHIPKKSLREIDDDPEIALEKILLVVSNLDSLHYTDKEFKTLNWEILHNQTKKENDNSFVYKKILNLLEVGSEKNGPMIVINSRYKIGEVSRGYKLGQAYEGKGWVRFQLSTPYLIQR